MKLHGYQDRRWYGREALVEYSVLFQFNNHECFMLRSGRGIDSKHVAKRSFAESVVDITVVRKP